MVQLVNVQGLAYVIDVSSQHQSLMFEVLTLSYVLQFVCLYTLGKSKIMKILEAQSAVLTNWEVYEHLQSEQAKFAPSEDQPRRRAPPEVYRMITKEVCLRCKTLGYKKKPAHHNKTIVHV